MRQHPRHRASRRARRLSLVVVVMTLVVLTSCDLTSDGLHQATTSHGSCRDVTLSHSRGHVRGTSTVFWQSGTSDYHASCAGLAARLLYRWSDGRFYENQWVWAVASAWSENYGAVASPAAEHWLCAASSDCAYVEN